MNDLLGVTAHRPFPPSPKPWIMVQTWLDLLFAHWPIAPEQMRALVPPPLELDLYDGQAWVAVTPFRITGLRPRGMPPLPGSSSFPELNLRTYVRYQGMPGVYFFSLDAGSRSAVLGARLAYGLPYLYADMALADDGGWIRYRSRRVSNPAAEFVGEYRPVGEARESQPGSIEHFLTERYCLYTVGVRGRVRRAHIHHVPWRLQPAEARMERNTKAEAAGIILPDTPPLLHFSRAMKVLVWWPEAA